MYWSVLGCIVAVEYVAEWVVCWIPFYYPLKTLFLLYLALPQTQGSTYIYTAHLQPFFASHEQQIDIRLAQVKVYVYTFLQEQARKLWDHVGAALSQQQQPLQEETSQQPQQQDGIIFSLWRSYGPGIMASGAAFLRQAVPPNQGQRQPAQTSTIPFGSMSANPQPFAASMSTLATAQAVQERRRQLEAELAALASASSSSSSSPLSLYSQPANTNTNANPMPMSTPIPAASPAYSRSSSGSDVLHRRERVASGGAGMAFEEVEVPSDVEGYDVDTSKNQDEDEGAGRPVIPQPRGSWFGWGGGSSKGSYERVKSE